jgi:L-threonylcarbamoyladenylate synthase
MTSSSRLADDLHKAVQVLKQGGVIVYPTETLYGLGVEALNDKAVQRLFLLKERPAGKPISLLIADEKMLARVVDQIPSLARLLMSTFWPGPLTLIFPASPILSPFLTGGTGTIGLRLSSHPLATTLVRELGRPLTTPSANPAGQPPPVRLAEAQAYFGAKVDYYLDGGILANGPGSTVVDVTGKDPVIVREGTIPSGALAQALHRVPAKP